MVLALCNQTKLGLTPFALLLFLFLKALHFVLKKEFCASGIEARGFIFGPPIALAIGAKFVPLRKPRKLPGIFHPLDVIPFIYQCFFMCIGIMPFDKDYQRRRKKI